MVCRACSTVDQDRFPNAYCEGARAACLDTRIIDLSSYLFSEQLLDGMNADQFGRIKLRLTALEIRILTGKYLEYLAANAFAYGYVQHFAGDGFAHGWVNDLSGSPFNLAEGRLEPQYNCEEEALGCYGDSVKVLEEIRHFNIESYVDVRYQPGLSGAPCAPLDYSASADDVSICDLIEGADVDIDFPVHCDYCNPLDYPPNIDADGQAVLSDRCDHCYPQCNPWRQICPMDPVTPEACAKECENLEVDMAVCTLRPLLEIAQCQIDARNACADAVQECLCDDALEVLAEVLPVDPRESPEYTCLSDDNRPSLRFQNFMALRARRYNH